MTMSSMGHDAGEHIMRAIGSPPANIGTDILGLELLVSAWRSVGVYSTYSLVFISHNSVFNREFLNEGRVDG